MTAKAKPDFVTLILFAAVFVLVLPLGFWRAFLVLVLVAAIVIRIAVGAAVLFSRKAPPPPPLRSVE